MKRIILMASVAIVAGLVLASFAVAQQLIIYPAKGQSEAKMSKDKGECHEWAIKQTGVDPAALAAEPQGAAQASGPKGERVRGGARGAAGGAAIGAIAGNAGKGAEIGAAAGGMRGGMKQREARREEKTEAQQSQAQKQQQLGAYNKAYSACLEGRGYTVK